LSEAAPPPFDEALLARIGGRRLAVGHRNPFLLSDPSEVWLVLRGQLDLHVVPLRDGRAIGTGRHLLTLGPGDLAFGGVACPLDAPSGLVGLREELRVPGVELGLRAIAPLGAELFRGDLRSIAGEAFDLQTVSWVDHWAAALSAALVRGARRVPTGLVEADPDVPVPAGSVLAAHHGDVVWVSLTGGAASFLGEADSPIEPGMMPVPVAEQSWITVEQAALVSATFSPQQLRRGQLWPALAAHHRRVARILRRHFLSDEVASAGAWQSRLAERSRAFAGGVADIASVLGPRRHRAGAAFGAPRVVSSDALLSACQAVGDALRVRIAMPSFQPESAHSPLDEIARASGLHLREVELRGSWWRQDAGPLLAFRSGDAAHPVALLPAGPGRYRLHDPAAGEEGDRVVDAALAAGLRPRAVMLYRPLPPPVRRFGALLRFGALGIAPDLATVAVMCVLTALLTTFSPIATGALLGTVLPNAQDTLHHAIIAGLAAAALGGAIFAIVRDVAVVRIQGRMDGVIQAAVWSRLLSLPAPFFRAYTAGDLADRAMGVNRIREALSGAFTAALLGSVASLSSLVLMVWYSPPMAMAAGVLLLLLAVASLVVFRLQLPHLRHAQEVNGRLQGLVFQLMGGIAKLRASGAEARAFSRWAASYADERSATYRADRIGTVQAVLTAVFPPLSSAVIFATLAWVGLGALPPPGAVAGAAAGAEPGGTMAAVAAPVAAGAMALGDFVAFNAAFGQLTAGVLGIVAALSTLLLVVPLFERITPILQAAGEGEEADGKAGPGVAPPGTLSGEIRFADVSFRYHREGAPVIDRLSLGIAAGEYVALVGASGAGKSTLVRLLLGFEQPENGGIYLDGLDLAGLDLRAVRRQIGIVLQNGRLQHGSIFENIVGNAPFTPDDAWEAARLAGLEPDIRAMPMGMQTVLSEGAQALSGGQRQRLLIARALIRRPRILVFDEATSALDNVTQGAVKATLDRLNVTRIVIAHRLSTISDVHRIVVLQDGRVAEVGSFEQLLKRGGVFADLARRQLAEEMG
jgi:ATP-binding cassette subfamily C protein